MSNRWLLLYSFMKDVWRVWEVSSTGITHEMRVKLLSTVSHSILSVVWRCVWHRKKILWDNWCTVHFYSLYVQMTLTLCMTQKEDQVVPLMYYRTGKLTLLLSSTFTYINITLTCYEFKTQHWRSRLWSTSDPQLFWADSNANNIIDFYDRHIVDEPSIVLLWANVILSLRSKSGIYIELGPPNWTHNVEQTNINVTKTIFITICADIY